MFDFNAKHAIAKNRDTPSDIDCGNQGITIFWIIVCEFYIKMI